MDELKTINGRQFSEILSEGRTAAVMFSSEWSSPCGEMIKIFREFSGLFKDELDTFIIDPDEEPMTALEQNVQTIPTVIFIRYGKEKARSIGARELDTLIKMKEKYIDMNGSGEEA